MPVSSPHSLKKMSIKVAVVIPSWNSAKDLKGLLPSLNKQKISTKIELSVILSDNASSDDSVSVAKTIYPNIVVVQNRTNLGLAAGNNIGILKALEMGCEGVIVLNADTKTDQSLVENLISASHRHPYSLLSPKIYFSPGHEFYPNRYQKSQQGKVIWYAGGEFDWDNILDSHRGVDQVDHGQFDKETKTDFATGCCMFIPAGLARDTHGFDEKLFLYREDTDLSLRTIRLGGQIWYIPSAVLWHVNAGSSGVGSGLQDYFTTRNRLLFALRWAAPRAKFAVIRESLKMLLVGRPWQKRGVVDFYLRRFGRGSYKI